MNSSFQAESDFLAVGYVIVAALALVVYDALLKFSDELWFIWKIWKQPLHLGSVLYVLARYGGILLLLMDTLVHFVAAETMNLRVVATAGVNGFLLTRAYAICKSNRSKWLIFPAAICYLGGIWAMLTQMAATRCNAESSLRQQTIIGEIATGFSLLLDLLVFIITTINMGDIWKEIIQQLKMTKQRRFSSSRVGLVTNPKCLRSRMLKQVFKLVRLTIAGIDGPLENAVSQILICRFQLDLIKEATFAGKSITDDFSGPPTFLPGSQGQSAGLTSGPSSLYVSYPDRLVKNTPRTGLLG
ncbi:hypothetical protein M422DRAFT_52428 [Sphaerobolus stellatus SS14]|uniref:DUF6533 domain-containing protein n=1 Tax=Sphaerobolus stellatus (strain SS14) TaxID=990650 RepID=A0A0C9TT96_SPHS4|nr:hypothetical protein M422DRAFT_52428 [Sphaerobolus stellatus SS14]